MKTQIAITLFFLFMISCKSDDVSQQVPNPVSKTIMVLGSASNDSLVLWVNDTLKLLNRGYQGQSDFKSGEIKGVDSSIYITAWENDRAIYYKNGIKTILQPTYSAACALNVSGTRVVAAGFTLNSNGGETLATYWDNGVRNTDYTWHTIYNALLLDGADLYLTGISSGKILYKKNNAIIPLSVYASEGMGIIKKGTDIYVAGNLFYSNGTYAAIWKNGVESFLENAPSAVQTYATGIYLFGNDIYVTGWRNGQPAYWKNGEPVILDVNQGSAWDLKVDGNDVYVAGRHLNVFSRQMVAITWKNGVPKEMHGANASAAFSILIR